MGVFDGIRLRIRLRELERDKARTLKAFSRDIAAAREKKASADEIYKIRSGENFEVTMIDESIYGAHTGFLVTQANRLIVPAPKFDDETKWSESDTLGVRYLTPAGINELRAAIRAERKLRREALLMWLPVVGAVTGLIGAMTGLVVIWSKSP
jgi:hypothetical protein